MIVHVYIIDIGTNTMGLMFEPNLRRWGRVQGGGGHWDGVYARSGIDNIEMTV